MVHDAVAVGGGEDFPGLGAFGDKTDGRIRSIGPRFQLFQKQRQVFLGVDFERQGAVFPALVFPAAQIRVVQVAIGEYGTIHLPRRTGKNRLLFEFDGWLKLRLPLLRLTAPNDEPDVRLLLRGPRSVQGPGPFTGRPSRASVGRPEFICRMGEADPIEYSSALSRCSSRAHRIAIPAVFPFPRDVSQPSACLFMIVTWFMAFSNELKLGNALTSLQILTRSLISSNVMRNSSSTPAFSTELLARMISFSALLQRCEDRCHACICCTGKNSSPCSRNKSETGTRPGKSEDARIWPLKKKTNQKKGSSMICGKRGVDGNQTIRVWHALASKPGHIHDIGPELEALVTFTAPRKSAMNQKKNDKKCRFRKPAPQLSQFLKMEKPFFQKKFSGGDESHTHQANSCEAL